LTCSDSCKLVTLYLPAALNRANAIALSRAGLAHHLRQLLGTKYDGDDLKLFMKLQLAAMNGEVKLESHERRHKYDRHGNGKSLELSYVV
jgi:hypothetical protein